MSDTKFIKQQKTKLQRLATITEKQAIKMGKVSEHLKLLIDEHNKYLDTDPKSDEKPKPKTVTVKAKEPEPEPFPEPEPETKPKQKRAPKKAKKIVLTA